MHLRIKQSEVKDFIRLFIIGLYAEKTVALHRKSYVDEHSLEVGGLSNFIWQIGVDGRRLMLSKRQIIARSQLR